MTVHTTTPERRWYAAAAANMPANRWIVRIVAFAVVVACFASPARAAIDESATPARIERVRYSAEGSSTRVIVLLSRHVPYEVSILRGGGDPKRASKARLVVDFSNARLGAGAERPIGVENGILHQIRTGQFTARTARVVLDLANVTTHSISELSDPPRLVIDIAGRAAPEGVQEPIARGEGEREAPTIGTRRGGASTANADAPRDESASAPGEQPRPEDNATAARRDQPGWDNDVTARRERPGRADNAAAGRDDLAVPGDENARAERDGASGRRGSSTRGTGDPSAGAAPDELASATRNAAPKADDPPSLAAATGAREEVAPATAEKSADERAPVANTEPLPADVPREAGEKRARSGEPPVVRRIVLDPGHGGNDPGARGVDGVLEKDVTLAIAKKLKRRLEDGLHAEVVLTRTSDATRTLAERTAFANARGADLFISIHANADAAGRLHGIETYTLNNSNDRATIRLAKMENGPAFRTPRGNLSFILSDLVQSGKEEESNALAERLHYRMLSRLRTRYPDVRDLGVKKGPFYVLVGAYMPCVLVETSFLSHPVEGRRLATDEYQAELVEGLYLGVADFFGDARMAKTL